MFALVLLLVAVAVAVAAVVGWARAQEAQPQIPMLQAQAVPPAPDVFGPREVYRHGQVLRRPLGTGEERVWIFTPDAPRPATAPVVLFLHGLGAVDPYEYGACINGRCVYWCVEGSVRCDGICTALGSDPSNCGACGHVCPASAPVLMSVR